MYDIPTPFTPKRTLEDHFSQRFYKRLRVEGPCTETVPPLLPYAGVNSLLRRLHAERTARRPMPSSAGESASALVGPEEASMQPAMDDSSSMSAASSSLFALPLGVDSEAMTNFSLADVVQCNHGPGGRCLQCSGRMVQNAPLRLHSAFLTAFGPMSSTASSSSSSSSSPLGSSASRSCSNLGATELSFPALMSLVACLAPEPGERLLHLGSGSGRAVAAWTLALPQSAACGIEPSPSLHQAAVAAAMRLGPDVQGRVFLHCGPVLATQGEWHQATVIFIGPSAFEGCRPEHLADGLQACSAGTRVVTVSQALSPHPGRAPPGFSLERQALFRNAGSGNSTLFIYRRLPPGD